MWKHSLIVGLLCAGLLAAGLWAQRQDLPAGAMQEKARTACLACHNAQIIVQQRLSGRGWTKSVDKMIRWGAPVAPEDREALINYLAQNFGPEEPPAKAELAEGVGAGMARAACLSCHGADLITAQQLDQRAWTLIVDKMIRWGAAVRPQDRRALVNYLATNYGPPERNSKEHK